MHLNITLNHTVSHTHTRTHIHRHTRLILALTPLPVCRVPPKDEPEVPNNRWWRWWYKYNNVPSSYLLLYYYYSTLSTTDDDNVFIYIHMSLDISVVYYGRNTSVADIIKGKSTRILNSHHVLNVWGCNVSAEIQQNSPLADLKRRRNELDWHGWICFHSLLVVWWI